MKEKRYKKSIGRLLLSFVVLTGLVALLLTGCGSSSKVTISFDTLGGPHVSPVTVTASTESLDLPTPRTREGYDFEYWCYDESATQAVDKSVVPTEDVTFYAKWTQQRVAVTFIADDTRLYAFVPYGEGLAVADMPAVPEKEGYRGRWDTGDLTHLTKNVIVYASYTVASYSLTYMVRNEVYYSGSGEPGQEAVVPEDPVIDGYVFLGWYYDVNFYDPVTESHERFSTSDVTMYARLVSTEGMERHFIFSTVGDDAVVVGLSPSGRTETVLVLPDRVDDRPVVAVAAGTEEEPTLCSEHVTTFIVPSSVRSIGDYAFAGCETMTELRLAYGVEEIGDYALSGLTSLTEFAVPASVRTLGDGLFAGDGALESVTFARGSSLVSMGQGLFDGCEKLTSFLLPDSQESFFRRASLEGSSISDLGSRSENYASQEGVIYDRDYAVAYACAPKKTGAVTLNASCKRIDREAFAGCSSLTSVVLSQALEEIGERAFFGCESLASVSYPVGDPGESLRTIGDYSFAGTGLTSVVLPGTIETLGEGAFLSSAALRTVDLSAFSADKIGDFAFADCPALLSVVIGATKRIGDHAFYNCRALASVTFPTTTLVEIGDFAFADCLSLKNETLPNTLQTIGDYAFAGISGHSTVEVSIPRALGSIGDYAFMDTDTRVFQPNATALTHFGVGAFKNCTRLTRANLPQTAVIDAVPKEAFYGCSALASLTVPINILTLDDYAFYGCTSLGSVTFNGREGVGVTTIGESCFENCSSLVNNGNLTRILPSTVSSIGARAFKGCASLREITVPASLRTISAEAFSRCSSLTTVLYEPDCALDTLEENCFAYCTSLSTVTLPDKLALRGTEDGREVGAVKNPFVGCNMLTNLSVTGNSEHFTAENGVVYYADGDFRVVYLYPTGRTGEFSVDNDVSGVDRYAFFGARLTALTFNAYPTVDGVEDIVLVTIGEYAFAESALLSANVSRRVYNIDEGAFFNAALTQVTVDANYVSDSTPAFSIKNGVENNLLSIGKNAFSFTSITSLSLPARVALLKEGAFSDCHSLRSLNFVQGTLTELVLEADAFRRDGYLTALVFPSQLKKIGAYAFADCNNVAGIVFSSLDEMTIGEYAFKSNHYLYSVLLSGAADLGEGVFYDCTRLKEVSFSSSDRPLRIPDFAFYGCDALETFTVPENTVCIGKSAFRGTNLSEVSFLRADGDGLEIDDYAFADTKSLLSVVFPDDLVRVGKYAFYRSALRGFSYGSADFTVEEHAFAESDLESVIVSERMTLDGESVFENTARMSTARFLSSDGSTGVVIPARSFYGSAIGALQLVGLGEESFRSVIRRFGDYSFAYCKNLRIDDGTDVTTNNLFVAADDLEIGSYAFAYSSVRAFLPQNADSLASIKIEEGAFFGAVEYTVAEVKATSVSIGKFAYSESGVTRISIRASETDLEAGFAANASSLLYIDVPAESNSEYYDIDGVVYRHYFDEEGREWTALWQFPAGKPGSVYEVPEAATEIADYAFIGTRYVTTLIIGNDARSVVSHAGSFPSTSGMIAYVKARTEDDGYEFWTIPVMGLSYENFVLSPLGSGAFAVVGFTSTDASVFVPGTLRINGEVFRVETIGENAFRNNTHLRQVRVDRGVREIGAYAFSGCTGLTSIELGDNVTVIKDGAFAGCVSLGSVRLDDDLATIGNYAFSDCTSMTSLTLPAHLVTIGSYAFAGCSGLTTIAFGEELAKIGDNAFEQNDNLVTIRLPASLASVGNYAFRGCDRLNFVYLSATDVPVLKSANAFGGAATGLKFFVPAASEKAYRSDAQWREYAVAIIGVSDAVPNVDVDTPFVYGDFVVRWLSDGDFYSLRLLSYLGTEAIFDMTASDSGQLVTEIGEYAIGPFTESVVLGPAVHTLENNAFRNAENLRSVVLDAELKRVGDYAFAGLKKLSSVTFEEGTAKLETIGKYAFFDCSSLTSFVLPSKLVSVGKYAFAGEKMHISDLVSLAPAGVELVIGEYAFANNVDLKTLTFNCAVTRIGDGAFSGCLSFASLYLNSIGSEAPSIDPEATEVFRDCDILAVFVPTEDIRRNYLQNWKNQYDRYRVYVSRNITKSYYEDGRYVEQDGFVLSMSSGSSTASVVAYVGDETEVVFPSTVRLDGGVSLLTVTRIGREENNSSEVSNGRVISDTVTKVTLPGTVTSVAGDAFRGANGLTQVVIENGDSATASIGNYAFAECPNLTSVVLSYNVNIIGQYAFADDESLTSFTIREYPSSAVDKKTLSIGGYALSGCTALTEISFPKHLGSLGTYVFNGDTALRSISLAEDGSLSTVGVGCFKGSAISTLTLPGTVTNVGDLAFENCNELVSVRLMRTTAVYNSLTTTSDNVFRGVNSVFVRVYVPEGNLAQYENATGWSRKTVMPYLVSGEYNYRRAVGSATVILTGYLGSDTHVVVPSYLDVDGARLRVTTINGYFGNDKIEEISFMPDCNISTLSDYAFAGCSSLKKIHLPDSVTSMGEYCFANCTSLTDVTLSEDLDMLNNYAFFGCTALKEIYVPASAGSVGMAAFLNCVNLIRVEIGFSAASSLGLSALVNTNEGLVIIVPEDRRDAFANEWSEYADIIYDRKNRFGDFVVKDDGSGGYVLVQYTGSDLPDLDDLYVNGRRVTSIQ
ncbi:MAG: leucine-rich repeat protein [Clostridia bacterium]|nr:leucine-rich repeat protein [Clostridia bacterium]